MAPLVFRDIEWSEYEGQVRARKILEFFQKRREFPTTFLFHGGNTHVRTELLAVWIQNILCKTNNACGNCPDCRKLKEAVHSDLIVFPTDQNIPIGKEKDPEPGSVRYIMRKLIPYHPVEGDLRFIVFPDATKIGDEAETALLKTLEEGPEHTIFVLMTNSRTDLKDTILSRSMQVPFINAPPPEATDATEFWKTAMDESVASVNFAAARDDFLAAFKDAGAALELEGRLTEWYSKKTAPAEWRVMDEPVEVQQALPHILALALDSLTESDKQKAAQVARPLSKFNGYLKRNVAGSFPYALAEFMPELAVIRNG